LLQPGSIGPGCAFFGDFARSALAVRCVLASLSIKDHLPKAHAAPNTRRRLDEGDLPIGVGRFLKKSQSFAFSAGHFFKYHPNVFEN
jgi:hypothetical protein